MGEFDNTTVTNMTTALDLGCKHLSGSFDTGQNRTRISNAIVGAARRALRVSMLETEAIIERHKQ